MCVRRKQSSACSGVSTIGSFSLNEVLSSIGTPVRPLERLDQAVVARVGSRLTVCSRPEPSTCVIAGITARLSGRTG